MLKCLVEYMLKIVILTYCFKSINNQQTQMENTDVNSKINDVLEKARMRFQQEQIDYYALAKQVLEEARPILKQLEDKYGLSNNNYQNTSDLIANFLIRCFNRSLDAIDTKYANTDYISLLEQILTIGPKSKIENRIKQYILKFQRDDVSFKRYANENEVLEAVMKLVTIDQVDGLLMNILKWANELQSRANDINIYNSYIKSVVEHIIDISTKEMQDEQMIISFLDNSSKVPFDKIEPIIYRRSMIEGISSSEYFKKMTTSKTNAQLDLVAKSRLIVKFADMLSTYPLDSELQEKLKSFKQYGETLQTTTINVLNYEKEEEVSRGKWIWMVILTAMAFIRIIIQCSH